VGYQILALLDTCGDEAYYACVDAIEALDSKTSAGYYNSLTGEAKRERSRRFSPK
jgi:hypothetical protein